jgi:hypothetical protein
MLTGYYSRDGNTWIQVGAPISAVNLDKTQPNFNSWVGTSVGLFAEGKPADFDLFVCKDGFSSIPAASCSNFYGVEKLGTAAGEAVTNNSTYGGWFMISGLDLGRGKDIPSQVRMQASSERGGILEVWLDDLRTGRKIATIHVPPTGGGDSWSSCAGSIGNVSGCHDLFIKFSAGAQRSVYVRNIQFVKKGVFKK